MSVGSAVNISNSLLGVYSLSSCLFAKYILFNECEESNKGRCETDFMRNFDNRCKYMSTDANNACKNINFLQEIRHIEVIINKAV